MTKKALYIFNPEHDLALASGETNYMAQASARRMASELALLPMWYAEEGSAVLASSAYNLDYLKQMQELLGVSIHLMTEPELAVGPDLDIRPWGWDVALRKRLLGLGVDEALLPSMEQLNGLREYSHRSKAVSLLPELQLNEYFCGESYYLKALEEWKTFVEERECCLLKAPLSGSGKGLNWCKGIFTPFISGWCTRVAASQGGIIAEPIYNKVEDFALEFYSDGCGGVRFAGCSMFSTNEHGAYTGNLLASDGQIEEIIARYLPLEKLERIREALRTELVSVYGYTYTGYLGVDMMICRQDKENKYLVHPCVEINMRMNMGVVARLFYDRFAVPGSKGRFTVEYVPDNGALRARHEQDMRNYPLIVENGRLLSGYLPLVPVTGKNCYRAYVRL